MTSDQAWWARGPVSTVLNWLRSLSAEGRDAFLYGMSALFAGVTALAVGIPLYRQWGQLAVGPYTVATVLMVVVARRRSTRPPLVPVADCDTDPDGEAERSDAGDAPTATAATTWYRPLHRWRTARLAAFVIVLLGATVVPLALEVVWAAQGNAALHVQPEVLVVERAGIRAAHGQDPYQVVDRQGHILIQGKRTEPAREIAEGEEIRITLQRTTRRHRLDGLNASVRSV